MVTEIPSSKQSGAKRRELIGAARADIGPAVGEQDHPIEPARGLELADLAGAEHDASVNGGGTANGDPRNPIDEDIVVRDALGIDQQLGHMVEGHHRGDVSGAETVHRHDRCGARLFESLPRHRAGTVDDERDVDGRAIPVGFGSAAFETDTKIIPLPFVTFHDAVSQTRIERDRLIGARARRKQQARQQQQTGAGKRTVLHLGLRYPRTPPGCAHACRSWRKWGGKKAAQRRSPRRNKAKMRAIDPPAGPIAHSQMRRGRVRRNPPTLPTKALSPLCETSSRRRRIAVRMVLRQTDHCAARPSSGRSTRP